MIDDPSNTPVEPDRERLFRRGYINGMSEVIYLLAHKLTDDELARVRSWAEHALWPWGLSDLTTAKRPPTFPELEGQNTRTHGMWFSDGP